MKLAIGITALAALTIVLVAPAAAADQARLMVYCDLKDAPYMGSDPLYQPDNGVACGSSFKQSARSCQVVVQGLGYCLYTTGGVGVGGYAIEPWIPTVCVAGEDCYGAEAGFWGKDGVYWCAVKVDVPGTDLEPCFTSA